MKFSTPHASPYNLHSHSHQSLHHFVFCFFSIIQTATSNPDEELLSSIASVSTPLSLKSGTLDLPKISDSLPFEINPTSEPTLNVIPRTTQTSTIST